MSVDLTGSLAARLKYRIAISVCVCPKPRVARSPLPGSLPLYGAGELGEGLKAHVHSCVP